MKTIFNKQSEKKEKKSTFIIGKKILVVWFDMLYVWIILVLYKFIINVIQLSEFVDNGDGNLDSGTNFSIIRA